MEHCYRLINFIVDIIPFMKRIFLLFIILFYSGSIEGQSHDHLFEHKHGIEVRVKTENISDLHLIKHQGITVDHGSNESFLNLYITQQGLEHLIQNDITFSFIKREPVKIKMKTFAEIISSKKGGNCLPDFDYYPTYDAYEQMMYEFEAQYPDLCRIINIGTLNSGRKLLIAQIGDNLDINEGEPNFLYSATMHGDELAGFPTMLKLIDHLLCNYDMDDQVTHLVNNVNIFINPLANPNGTYTSDNSTVFGARRENASFVDLNRNYPDPKVGDNPDNRSYQEETLAFLQFTQEYKINLSCNIHGGAELINYPWDTFQQRHADDDWWVHVSRNYVDTVHSHSPNGYMTDFNNGITNGFDWFEAQGTRQDNMTYFDRGREFTLEISDDKVLSTDQLANIWNYNKNALLNYINESLYGLKGSITDCTTGLPITAEVFIEGHDIDNSSVFSDSLSGLYFRYLKGGSYLIQYQKEGYDTIVQDVSIIDKSITVLDVELCEDDLSMSTENIESSINLTQAGNNIVIYGDLLLINAELYIFDLSGRLVQKSQVVDKSIKLIDDIRLGLYYVRLHSKDIFHNQTLLIK